MTPKGAGVATAAIGGLLLGLHYLIFSQFLPNRVGGLGNDYGMFLPALLDGYFWYEANGLLTVPWFTASFCGGLPKFPNPQALYFSVPQFLVFVVDPLQGVRLTLLLFGFVGLAGTYALLRRAFAVSRPVAELDQVEHDQRPVVVGVRNAFDLVAGLQVAHRSVPPEWRWKRGNHVSPWRSQHRVTSRPTPRSSGPASITLLTSRTPGRRGNSISATL